MTTFIKRRYKLLDLYCGAGGASMGYWITGFDVIGVDIVPQPNYPFEFVQADALTFAKEHISEFHAVHGSPPCHVYSSTRTISNSARADMIPDTRELFFKSNLPYIIENVDRAPLNDPLILCGATLGLKTYRHRLFETNFHTQAPPHVPHVRPQADMGARPLPHEFMSVIGSLADVSQARQAMGIHWMTGKELSQAVPPAYSAYIGSFLRQHLDREYAKKPLFAVNK